MYVIIIILIVVLLIAAIFINAIQQHRQKQEAERRTELAKQRTIVDETENVIAACVNIPVSSRIMGILHNRILWLLAFEEEGLQKAVPVRLFAPLYHLCVARSTPDESPPRLASNEVHSYG